MASLRKSGTAAVSLTVLMSGSSPTVLNAASAGGTMGVDLMAGSGSWSTAAPTEVHSQA